MTQTRLQIDTSHPGIPGPSSARGLSAASGGSSAFSPRSRSLSSASASSSASSAGRDFGTSPSSAVYVGRNDPMAYYPAAPSPTESTDSLPGDNRDAQEYVLAMHDFVPQHPNVTCLAFRAGQVIHVLNRDSSGWWDGELDGRRGWFPSNYVTAEVGLLTDEELPKLSRSRSGHSHNKSVASAVSTASWATTRSGEKAFIRTDHRPMGNESDADSYCPPLMVPLLHGLSLLQNAARANRVTHFQPSTACIISCVRAILSDIGCLARDAPLLKRHGVLGQERKRILSDLASLVSQSKRASDVQGITNEELRELETEAMVRLGGQLFAHVRGFLALVVQCGVSLPTQIRRPQGSIGSEDRDGMSDAEGTLVRSDADDGEYDGVWNEKTTNGIEKRPRSRQGVVASKTGGIARAKSLGDLKARKQAVHSPHRSIATTPQAKGPWAGETPKALKSLIARHKPSMSSVSSSSSVSSDASVRTPATPVFPSGPSSAAEVLEALRFTHDHYLSTIAAFIGHAHSHSRTSHASSTGHMYDLVREVVDMVCKLLTIVEAVLKHPDVPAPRATALKTAKENLFAVTSKLADSVKSLTVAPAPDVSEEEEKATLLRCATDALKAGSDCVSAVKKCLQRTTGERPFIIQLPPAGDPAGALYTPRKFTAHRVAQGHTPKFSRSSSLHALRGLYLMNDADGEDEDLTIQAQTFASTETPGRSVAREETVPEEPVEIEITADSESEAPPEGSLVKSPKQDKPLPPLLISTQAVEAPQPSPASFAHTEDDRTTWEGSVRQPFSPLSLEEKLLNGELPAVPGGPLPSVAVPLSHDHAQDDVAYNSDGQLVGATLAALVERMTPHDSLVEPPFAAVFFLTFRLFTTPTELLQAVIDRYNILPPPGLSDEDLYAWQQRKGLPVRLRVSNFVKLWLESYWRPSTDNIVLPALVDFTRDALSAMFPVPSQRIMDLINQWVVTNETGIMPRMDRMRDAGIPLNPPSAGPSEVPRPIMTKNVLNALRNKSFASINVTDFDTLELARQLTTMECTLYCAIQPEEILEMGQKGGTTPVNVKAVTSLSTVITGWVAESILNEVDPKKRTALLKFFIKLADRCVSIQNYSTSRSILAALDSSTISRLQQTWSGLSQKTKAQLEALRKLADHARNYSDYRARLRNTAPPAVPFLGLYLTDVTFCREGNPSHRASPKSPDKKLLNFNKYHKLARIVQDMQRFQVPYSLKTIPEVQDFLKHAFEQSKHRGDLQDLYRRSLMIEPRRPADNPPASDVSKLFTWSRSQSSQAAVNLASSS